jgi:hypothetical protein
MNGVSRSVERELIVCEVRVLGVQPAEDTAYFLWWAESVPVANDSVGVERVHIDERAPAIARGGIEIDADALVGLLLSVMDLATGCREPMSSVGTGRWPARTGVWLA